MKAIAKSLDISISEILSEENGNNCIFVKEDSTTYNTGEFKTAEDAIKFILKQPTIMGYGGFDINKMREEEIIEFANELLRQLEILSYKYKR